MATANEDSDELYDQFASPNEGDSESPLDEAKAHKTVRKTLKSALTRALNEALALVRRKANLDDVTAQRLYADLKLAELTSANQRFNTVVGRIASDDSEGYMADVRSNFNAATAIIDTYLAVDSSRTSPETSCPKKATQQLMPTFNFATSLNPHDARFTRPAVSKSRKRPLN